MDVLTKDGNLLTLDGKALMINGYKALTGSTAPITTTVGVVGQAYYVIVDSAVTEMYVCTAVTDAAYTWDKVEFGGGSTGTWRRIKKITTTENVNSVEISTDEDGDAFELVEFAFYVYGKSLGASGNIGFKINDILCYYGSDLSNTNTTTDLNVVVHGLFCGRWMYELKKLFNASFGGEAIIGMKETVDSKMVKFFYGATNSNEVGFQTGTIFELWGR